MKEIHQTWQFENEIMRTVTIAGKTSFGAHDVTKILGYPNSTEAISKYVAHEDVDYGVNSRGFRRPLSPTVNEFGLFSLILSSKSSNAKKFKGWVLNEVLPAIRKREFGSNIPKSAPQKNPCLEDPKIFFSKTSPAGQKDQIIGLAPRCVPSGTEVAGL